MPAPPARTPFPSRHDVLTAATPHAYADLTPAKVLDLLEAAGLHPDGRLLALNSFENRVYQFWQEEDAPGGAILVAKFYRPGRWSDAAILEEHAFISELAQAEIPAVPALPLAGGSTLLKLGQHRIAVFPRQGGRAPELEDAGTLAWLGRFLGRIHLVGARAPFRARPALDANTFGKESRDWLLAEGCIPPDLEEAWRSTVDMALESVAHCYERAGPVRKLRLHGDCHMGNVLWVPEQGPHFVDFDDARSGPAIQDLWMLLSGERADMQRQLGQVLEGYQQFRDFDYAELNLIEALRTLRLIHHSAWIARRWHDPAFPAAFPWFDSPIYWQQRILELREQIALMDEPPLEPV